MGAKNRNGVITAGAFGALLLVRDLAAAATTDGVKNEFDAFTARLPAFDGRTATGGVIRNFALAIYTSFLVIIAAARPDSHQ